MRSIFLQAGQEIQTRKIALGFFIISVFYILGSLAIGLVCSSTIICSFSSGLGRTPLNLLFVLFTFVPIWIGVWIAMKFIHHLPMKVLLGSSSKLDSQLLIKGFLNEIFDNIPEEKIRTFLEKTIAGQIDEVR